MKVFDSMASLRQLEGSPLLCPVRRVVLPVVSPPSYQPEEDGYVVLVEPPDVSRALSDLDLPYRLHEVPFEGVSLEGGLFHAVYLANNQFALSFLVPDADWLPDEALQHTVLVHNPTRLYWADLHGHTRHSDGTGTPYDYFRYARDVARL